MCFSMSRFRVVEAGGPIRDVAVETTTNPLQNLCRTASQSFRKKSTTEFAENFLVELDNHRNRGRTWAIRPRRPDSTVGKQQMCTCGARKRCQNLTSTMKHGVPMMWTTTSLLVGLRRRVEDFCRRRLRFVLVCIESWDVRRCETHWVPP